MSVIETTAEWAEDHKPVAIGVTAGTILFLVFLTVRSHRANRQAGTTGATTDGATIGGSTLIPYGDAESLGFSSLTDAITGLTTTLNPPDSAGNVLTGGTNTGNTTPTPGGAGSGATTGATAGPGLSSTIPIRNPPPPSTDTPQPSRYYGPPGVPVYTQAQLNAMTPAQRNAVYSGSYTLNNGADAAHSGGYRP